MRTASGLDGASRSCPARVESGPRDRRARTGAAAARCVDDAEHGGVEADAERQREDGDSGEAGRARQRARRVADASGEVIHADSRGRAEEWSAAYRRVY